MLVDHTNSGANGIRRRVKNHRFSVNNNFAFIRSVQAVQLPHQGAFAGAIFAKQCMHFTGLNIKADF